MRLRVTKNSVTITDAAQNNLVIPGQSSYIVIDGTLTAGRAITGIVAGRPSDIIYLRNNTGQILSLTNDSGSSSVGNKFHNPNTLTIAVGATRGFIYDGDLNKWVVL